MGVPLDDAWHAVPGLAWLLVLAWILLVSVGMRMIGRWRRQRWFRLRFTRAPLPLTIGDQVTTTLGIRGEVVAITDHLATIRVSTGRAVFVMAIHRCEIVACFPRENPSAILPDRASSEAGPRR